MSKVFNMVGGGGGATASIFVKGLSETDTVTATNGSKTKTGVWTTKDSVSGWLFDKIKDYGTWTVTATDGEQTATQDVLVDVITEYDIEMLYSKLYLYRDGDECEDVTGGWYIMRRSSNGSVTKNTDNITMSTVSGSNEIGIGTLNAVSLNGFTHLKCKLDEPHENGMLIFIFPLQYSSWNDADQHRDLYKGLGNSYLDSELTFTFDISSVNTITTDRIHVGISGAGSSKIKRIWLER